MTSKKRVAARWAGKGARPVREKAAAKKTVPKSKPGGRAPLKQALDKPRVSARMPWAQLAWHPVRGRGPLDDGPLRLLVVSPWCADCAEALPRLAASLRKGRTFLVGEFAGEEEVLEFAGKCGVSEEVPVLAGTRVKSDVARIEARFRQLRTAFGDPRTWGVPTLLEGRLENGEFIAEKFSDPSA